MSKPSAVKFIIKIVNWSLDYSSSSSEEGVNKLATPILLQDINGPCPLIALINTLLLTYDIRSRNYSISKRKIDAYAKSKRDGVEAFKKLLITYHQKDGSIDLNKVLSQLGDLILIYKDDKPLNYEIDKLLDSLPLLHTGLSVNPNLINGNFVKDDLASVLFDLFDLKFKHGWVVNQIENENPEWNFQVSPIPISSGGIVEGSSSSAANQGEDSYARMVALFNKLQNFDEIQDFLLTEDPNASDETQASLAQDKEYIKKWIDLNRTQLTKIGLNRLNYEIAPEEFIIFFRNNHFNTLFKKSDSEFYLLITDSSFQDKSSAIIWQSVNSISGKDDLFFDGDFLPILDIDQDVNISVGAGIDDSDLLLVKQLQQEEDEALAKEMQEKFDRKAKAAAAKAVPPAPEKDERSIEQNSLSPSDKPSTVATTGDSNEKKKKKRPNCSIM
ncbi:uncharacterized protein RJT20DRAFT_39825 [Scheffersomyces xylosifermentans]|uniref:uncharacterized protein n=1 Tax=Scheffersomyces xylosifermentans TaxID=1304137 RepID=UPI00315C6711